MRRKLAAGNWKMNGSLAALGMISELNEAHKGSSCDIVICPPAPLLLPACRRSAGGVVEIGAQDCHSELKGAHTGDCSAALIAEMSASYTILGHSERRTAYSETDAFVASKAAAAQSAGLTAIICVGETLHDRETGNALDVISRQLSGSLPTEADCDLLVIAYEPIWAIGTGKIPTLVEIAEVHAAMRTLLTEKFGDVAKSIRLLYGGSVKPDNAGDIFGIPDVDGALVGGASLRTQDFSPIITALQHSC